MNADAKNNRMKLIRVLVYLILSTAIGTGVRVISSIIRGEHGAPDFKFKGEIL